MSENGGTALEEIDYLIQLSKETIEKLKKDWRSTNRISESIAASKNIARLAGDIRRLVRMRMKLQKEAQPKKENENDTN